ACLGGCGARKISRLRVGGPGHYADLLSLDDVDALIGLSGLVAPPSADFRLVKTTENGAEFRPPQDQAIASLRDVYLAYAQGYTVIVDKIERHWAPVAAPCRGLEPAVGCRVGANLYLTPRQAQGFSPHYDTHDVFILQLAGAKTWLLYGSPTPLPLPAPVGERSVSPDQLGAPIAECRLADG